MKVLSYYAGIDYKIGLAVSYKTVVHIIYQSDSVIISTRGMVTGIEPVTLLVPRSTTPLRRSHKSGGDV